MIISVFIICSLNSGKWLEFVKSLQENKGLPAKGAVVIEIEEC